MSMFDDYKQRTSLERNIPRHLSLVKLACTKT